MVDRVVDLATRAYRIAVEYSCGTAAMPLAARKLAWAYLEDLEIKLEAQRWVPRRAAVDQARPVFKFRSPTFAAFTPSF